MKSLEDLRMSRIWSVITLEYLLFLVSFFWQDVVGNNEKATTCKQNFGEKICCVKRARDKTLAKTSPMRVQEEHGI